MPNLEQMTEDGLRKTIDDAKAALKSKQATNLLPAKQNTGKGGRKGTKVAVKYRDGVNTWTGRGKKPVWLRDAIAGGASLESFLVPELREAA